MTTLLRRSIVAAIAVAAIGGAGAVVFCPNSPKQSAIEPPNSEVRSIAKDKPTGRSKTDAQNAERARINIAAAEDLERMLADDSNKPTNPGGH